MQEVRVFKQIWLIEGTVQLEVMHYLTQDRQTASLTQIVRPVAQAIQHEGWKSIEELAELLHPDPLSGPEIVERGLLGGWADMGITDSTAWVEAQRQNQRGA